MLLLACEADLRHVTRQLEHPSPPHLPVLALGTIVYRWAIADGNEASSKGHRDDVHVGLLERGCIGSGS
jgi:hypothetical protein